jgi:hypothetical protein
VKGTDDPKTTGLSWSEALLANNFQPPSGGRRKNSFHALAVGSVTDSFGRTWNHKSLYLTGSGLFPTVDAANPTLTIVAVTLRQAQHLIERLREPG